MTKNFEDEIRKIVLDREKGSVQIALEVINFLDNLKGKVEKDRFEKLCSFASALRPSMTAIEGLLKLLKECKSFAEIEKFVLDTRQKIFQNFVREVSTQFGNLSEMKIAVASYSSLVKFCLQGFKERFGRLTIFFLEGDKYAERFSREIGSPSSKIKTGTEFDFAVSGADSVWLFGGKPAFVVNGSPSLSLAKISQKNSKTFFCLAESFKFSEGEPKVEEGFDKIPAEYVKIISDR